MNKNKRTEIMRLGNFTVYGVKDIFGHQTMMEICAVSKNWMMRIDEGTFMFGIIKSVMGMAEGTDETKSWYAYLQSLIHVEYQFGTCGVPVDILMEIGKMLMDYAEKQAQEVKKLRKKDEKETLSDLRREVEMKEELQNIDKNGN